MTRRPARWVAVLTLALPLLACGDTRAPVQTDAGPETSSSTTHPPSTTTTAVQPTTTLSTTTTVLPPQPVTTVPPVTTTEEAVSARPAAVGSCAGWEETIAAHFPPEQVGKACAVMLCETGGTGDPTIHNPRSSASGLFQFLDGTWTSTTGTPAPAASYPGSTQVAAAASLWRSSGWSPWGCA